MITTINFHDTARFITSKEHYEMEIVAGDTSITFHVPRKVALVLMGQMHREIKL